MSSNPPAPPPFPAAPDVEVVKGVADVLAVGLSIAFPEVAPAIAGGEAVLMKLAPWVLMVIEKKQLSVSDLRAMQVDINSLGPSFPKAPGYSNAFGGGLVPAPGTNPRQAPAQSATLNINGVTVTVSAASSEALIGFITGLLTPKKTP